MAKQVHHPVNLVLLALVALVVLQCRTRYLQPAPAVLGSSSVHDDALRPYRDFCEATEGGEGAGRGPAAMEFLTPAEMEGRIAGWLELTTAARGSPELKPLFRPSSGVMSDGLRASSILTAYGSAYREMIKVRDQARCDRNGPMWSADPLVRQINHGLADLMTRNLILINKSCLLDAAQSGGYAAEPIEGRWEFCDVMFDAATGLIKRYNAMTIAMSSTVIYLTSHMAAALSALPFMDRLWVDSPFFCLPSDPRRTECLRQRIDFIRVSYKAPFDAFNSMLARSLDTVSGALLKDGHLSQSVAPVLSSLIEEKSRLLTALIGKMFGLTRDDSFNLGLEMAVNLARLQASQDVLKQVLGAHEIHPFLEARLGREPNSGVSYYEIRDSAPLFSASLLSLDGVRRARRLTWRHRIEVESLTATALFRGLGAVTYEDGFKAKPTADKSLLSLTLNCLVNSFKASFGSEGDLKSAYQKKSGVLTPGDVDRELEVGLTSSRDWQKHWSSGVRRVSASCPDHPEGI